jgi:hypothetical protein
MNSSSGTPIDGSTSVISSRLTPGANAFSFSFLRNGRHLHPARALRPYQRRRHQQPGHRIGVHDRPRHQVGPVRLLRVGEHAIDDPFVHTSLSQPAGGDVRVVRRVVAGVILVEVVEEAGEPPQFLVLAEPPGERPHHALHRDQVPDRRLLQALLAGERVGGRAVHHAPTAVGADTPRTNGTLDRTTRGSKSISRLTNSAF